MQWCEIFKTGEHTDSKGNKKVYHLSELNKMKENFEQKNPDVPICCGHPKSNSPAYGWFDKLKIEPNREFGYSLYAAFKNVQEDFKNAVNKGLYKTRSISFTPDLMIRHLAFLGAQTPAVKRLEEFCFEESEDDIKIETDADYNITNSTEPIGDDNISSPPPVKENIQDERITIVNDEEFKQQLSEKDNEIAELKKQLDDEKKLKQAQDFEDFCNKAIENGNILPAQKNAIIDILTASSDYEPFEFSDGGSKTVVDMVKDFIGSIKQFDLDPVATNKKASDGNSIDFSDSDSIVQEIKKIQAEYKQKGIEINNIEAMNIINEREV